MTKALIFSATLIALIGLSGCVPAGDPITESYEASIADTGRIEIDLSTTDLVIQMDDGEDVTIEFLTYDRGPELTVREGKTLRIKEDNDLPFFINFDQSPKLIITVPHDYEDAINIETSSGDVDLTDMMFENLAIQISSGDLFINNLTSENVNLDLSSGDIIIDDAKMENLTIKTSSGDVELIDVQGKVSGRSSSGDVTVEMSTIKDDFSYNLSSGDFQMSLEDGVDNARFDLSCSSGDIDLDFDLDDYDRDEDDKVRGQIGDGDYDVEIDTSSGNIDIY